MISKLQIDVTSFYQTQYKRLRWTLNDQTQNETEITIEEESVTERTDMREAIEHHVDQITEALPEGRLLSDYEVTLSFDDSIKDEDKSTFTRIFNEFNTRDESD